MNGTLSTSDDLAACSDSEAELPRYVPEALALNACRTGPSDPELRALLGLQTRSDMHSFLESLLAEGIVIKEFDGQIQNPDRHTATDDLVARSQAFAAGHTLDDLKNLIHGGRR